ncbi:response regulator [Chitinophaga oryziterrae]|uniref:Response regulator n=1 Tax=Chitinophaga oryziterrae TaxID=1031224 RepID=A0A6N8JGD3_9BACT|nr:response regulator transcription factor [Chitinophaga oryziterrae]MVT43419.1 response regulator [Chitinophaga oryziterrae]
MINKIKIALVDDHNLFRKGLIKLINIGDSKQRYDILFEADNGNQLKEKMKTPPFPDIILMDIDMPEVDGFESVEWLQRTHGDVKVLVMTMLEKEAAILRMLRMGVKGYIHKDIEVEDLHAALESIAANGFYYSEAASEVLHQNLNGLSNAPIHLSEKEREFIKLAATDMTYQQVADKMNLSVKTIDGYREALFRRLNVKTRVTLALYAVKHGLAEL